jgi:hypothetical protein
MQFSYGASQGTNVTEKQSICDPLACLHSHKLLTIITVLFHLATLMHNYFIN